MALNFGLHMIFSENYPGCEAMKRETHLTGMVDKPGLIP